jgi:hypothetical protein
MSELWPGLAVGGLPNIAESVGHAACRRRHYLDWDQGWIRSQSESNILEWLDHMRPSGGQRANEIVDIATAAGSATSRSRTDDRQRVIECWARSLRAAELSSSTGPAQPW